MAMNDLPKSIELIFFFGEWKSIELMKSNNN